MARQGLKMGLALVLMTTVWACSLAQPTCPPAIASLQPCLAYITSNSSTPPPQCCSQLSSMVQSQAQCLCTFLNAAPPLPFNINQTQAITLPGACNIQAPPLSQCTAQSGPFAPAPPSGPFVPGAPTGPFIPGAPTGPFVPGAPTGPFVPGAGSGPLVPAAGSPQGAPATVSPVTPSATATPSPAAPVIPSAPSGTSPPSTPTPSTKGAPPAQGGSKAGPNKPSSSAGSSTMFTPSLFVFLLVASIFSGF